MPGPRKKQQRIEGLFLSQYSGTTQSITVEFVRSPAVFAAVERGLKKAVMVFGLLPALCT